MKTTLAALKSHGVKIYAKMMEFNGTSVPVISLPDQDQLVYPGKKMQTKVSSVDDVKNINDDEIIIEAFTYDNEHGQGTSLRYYTRNMEGWEAL